MSAEDSKRPTRLSPREYMRHRRPDEFSDSSQASVPSLDRAQLEYHLSTITNRSEEVRFEDFARRMAQHEICPNLLPHTGPTGGGDSKVDSETYPVADDLTLAWFEGDPAAASERWGFAFSAKEDWRSKVQSDVRKLVKTGRGYKKAFFISSQYIRDKERSNVEDSLGKECGIDVRIMDRGWLLDRVFENRREQVAIDELKLTPPARPKRTKGPRDVARESDLEETEARIDAAVAAQQFFPALVENCLRTANLSAALDRPRAETDGRFLRAQRLAARCGTTHQQLYVDYQWAWRSHFWFEDTSATIPLYLRVEAAAVGTDNVFELELLQNLWNVLRVACSEEAIPAATWDYAARARILEAEYQRLAEDENRPSIRLQAQKQLLFLRLMMEGATALDDVAKGLARIVEEASNLIGFPMRVLADIVSEFGASALDSRPFDDLVALIADIVAKRAGEEASARVFLRRAAQQMSAGKVYEAIRTAGLTLFQLYKFETRDLMLRALWLIGDAYERVGLFWAARGTYLFAASVAVNEFWRENEVTQEQAICYKRLKWLELRLGRIAHALSWHEIERIVSAVLQTQGVSRETLDEDERSFDAALGILFLRAEISTLRQCEKMYDALESVGLLMAPMALVHALGHSNEDIAHWLSLHESDRTADDLFLLLRDQPASDELPESIEDDASIVELQSTVLGCRVRVFAARDAACIEVAESFVAAFEAFLATAVLSRVTPHQSTISVYVERRTNLKTVAEVAKPAKDENVWRVSIAPTVAAHSTSQAHQLEIQDALTRVVIEAFARTFFVGDLEKTMHQLGEDKALERAINFANSFSCVGNILGNEPKFRLSDWVGVSTQSCVRTERWDGQLPPKARDTTAAESIADAAVLEALRAEQLDLNEVKHADISASSVLDLALWDKAQWTGALYIVLRDELGTPSGVPGLAFLFKNRSAGERIFEKWVAEFSHDDRNETIRVSILRGIKRRKPHHYRIMISSDPTKGVPRVPGGGLKVFSVTAKANTMEPETSANLDGFLLRFQDAKEFILLPGFLASGGGPPSFSAKHYIRKRELFVRNAWEIGLHDMDRTAIHSDDDPIIPANHPDPPIKALLAEVRDRERAATPTERTTPPPQSQNSPCKCGSGRKYKKCCGAAPSNR